MHHWESIEAFIEVARLGSLSAAATKLRVSSSHISRLLSHLEQRLNTQLLVRTTRRVTLTESGQWFFEQSQTLADGFSEAEQQITSFSNEPHGLLRVSCGSTFGERYIGPMLTGFMQQQPRLSLDLNLTNRSVDLVNEGYDLAIRLGALKDSNLVARRLSGRREYVVATADYLASRGTPQSLAELAQHNCLRGSTTNWSFCVDGQRKEIRAKGNWHANSGVLLLQAALQGLGLACLPDYIVEPHLNSGALVSVLDAFQCQDTAVWAVYPRSRHLSPKVRHCIDYLVESFENPDWRKSCQL
ncbi:LysR family transcriptional regulator [Marinobacterium rhizophilum]|uniref:LysR family transcriptional regulator n=1 Tax=Marinobacterium rhizophilum TaxID=420402 RepID=A0ABY5HDQ2_9GAMM|nr:LysR family transcriptional regulator [Marinobacterium rhizophilum]UTW10224.1 LysR family transcriptional regulator [Marinobacterium rhizophilum]